VRNVASLAGPLTARGQARNGSRGVRAASAMATP